MTRDEMIAGLFELGFSMQSTASNKWKTAFFLRENDKTLLVLIRTRGVDLFETSRTRDAMTNEVGTLSVRVSDEGNRFGECNYTHNDLNVNYTVLKAATKFAEGATLNPELFQKTGIGRTEWGHKFGNLSKKQEQTDSDNSLSDIYYAASSGDGGPAYLGDGVWIDEDGSIEDRGR